MSSMSALEEKLVFDNYDLVPFCVNKYFRPKSGEFDDLVQIGRIGLCNAAKTYRASVGLFSTYACSCIRNHIRHEFAYRNRKRRIPQHKIVSLDMAVASSEEGDVLSLRDTIPVYDDAFDFVITLDALQSAIETLDASDKAIARCLASGGTVREIGAMLSVSSTTAQKRIRRVRNKLKAELAS